jgi:hypothetical protein
VIRRAFWLGAGAAAGIAGYRRVSALGRRLSGQLPGTVAAGARVNAAAVTQRPRRPLARTAARSAFGMARETVRFTRDVREGMEIYIARQDRPERPILTRTPEEPEKDGR